MKKMKTYRKALIGVFVTLLLVTSSVTIFAEGNSLSSGTDVNIVPTIREEDGIRIATIDPFDFERDLDKVVYIKQSEIDAFIEYNEIDKVEIISGMGAKTPDGNMTPQIIIVDDDGNTVAKVVALGCQFRFENKIDGTTVRGLYSETGNTNTAYDYIDFRHRYKITLPSGVSMTDSTTKWFWVLHYIKNGADQNKNVNGKNYLPVPGESNTYTSNAVITNIPVLANMNDNIDTRINVTYEYNGVVYNFIQSEETFLTRNIGYVYNQLMTNEYSTMNETAKAYMDALSSLIEG